MDHLAEVIAFSSLAFIKHIGGTVMSPYKTYRRIIEHGKLTELLYVAGICVVYFAVSSVVKIQSFHPLLLTQQFMMIFFGAGSGYILMVSMLCGLGKLFGGQGDWEKVSLAWAYSYIPTTIWFLATSVLYVLLPPPRTQAPLGILFSLVYLLFSTVLFFWKAELYYLTLRFGMRLDLKKITYVTAVVLPVLVFYSIFMYQMKIFGVPFL